MSIRNITDESHFQNELTAAGDDLVVVDFTAGWCGPCQRIAPQFEKLAAKYPKAIFLKVDVDKCEDTAVSQGVTAMPTFFFYRNSNRIDCLKGANIEALASKLEEHMGGKVSDKLVTKNEEKQPEEEKKELKEEATKEATKEATVEGPNLAGINAEDDEALGLMDLNNFILKQGCECLNECDDHPLAHCLIPNDEFYLQSDCDGQLIMSISFNQLVKINSMRIKAPADQGPKDIKLFINITKTLDFESAESMPGIQELVLEPKDLDEGATINLRFVKFQNVQNIQVYVRNNQTGSEVTRIGYIGFVGLPVKTTNMTDFKRVAGKVGEAH